MLTSQRRWKVSLLWYLIMPTLCSLNRTDRVRIGLRLTSAFEWFCDGGGDAPLDHVRLCKLCVWMKNVTLDRALANAIQNYHRTQGWQKEIGCPEYWYSGAHPPAPSQTLREDQALAYALVQSLQSCVPSPTELVDALRLFIPNPLSPLRYEPQAMHTARGWYTGYGMTTTRSLRRAAYARQWGLQDIVKNMNGGDAVDGGIDPRVTMISDEAEADEAEGDDGSKAEENSTSGSLHSSQGASTSDEVRVMLDAGLASQGARSRTT